VEAHQRTAVLDANQVMVTAKQLRRLPQASDSAAHVPYPTSCPVPHVPLPQQLPPLSRLLPTHVVEKMVVIERAKDPGGATAAASTAT
jgi:predicted component of type VI protein secretion system